MTGLLNRTGAGRHGNRNCDGRDAAGVGVYRFRFRWSASLPPDVVTGGILGVAFAINSGAGGGSRAVIRFALSTLALIVKNIYNGMFIPFNQS